MFRKITKRQWTIIITLVVLIALLFFLLPISIPLIAALFTALVLNPIVRLLQEKTKLNRQTSVIIIFFILMLMIGFISTFIVTKVIAQVVNFVEDIPVYFQQINQVYEKWNADFQQYTQTLPPEFINQVSTGIEENLTALSETVKDKITIDSIAQVFAKIPQFLVSFLVYLIALFLFMLELPLLKAKTYNLFTKETAKKVSFMNERLSNVLLGFLKAQFFLSLIIFVASLVGLLFISPEVALIMSIIIWIIDLIPIIGSIIILGPWALYMFLSGNTIIGIKLSVLAIILLAIRRIVEPKVMGQNIGLSPLLTLITMFLGLKLFGIIGLIIGPLIIIGITSAIEADIIKWEIKI